jgi:hypothetical protein
MFSCTGQLCPDSQAEHKVRTAMGICCDWIGDISVYFSHGYIIYNNILKELKLIKNFLKSGRKLR